MLSPAAAADDYENVFPTESNVGGSAMNIYSYTIMLSKENGGYRALCPALPGCRAHGTTKKEVIQNIKISISHRLEVLRKKGKPIPRDKELV